MRAPSAGDADPRRKSASRIEAVTGYVTEALALQLTDRQVAKWARQVGQLYDLVPSWTGNQLQVVEMSAFEWADHRRRHTSLFVEIDRDAIQVAGDADRPGSTRAGAR